MQIRLHIRSSHGPNLVITCTTDKSHRSRVEVGVQDVVIHVHLCQGSIGDQLEAHEQWGHTRAMESTTPTMTLVRRRMTRSTSKSVNRKSASQEEDVLIFFSCLET